MACNQADDDLNGRIADWVNAESPDHGRCFKSSHCLKRCQCSCVVFSSLFFSPPPRMTWATSVDAIYQSEPFFHLQRALTKKMNKITHLRAQDVPCVPLTTMRRGSAAPIRAAALGNKVMSAKSSQSPLILCENVESSATVSLPSLCLFKILRKSSEVGWHSLHIHYLFILTYF